MSSDDNILSGLPPLDGHGSGASGATNASARGSTRPWPPTPPTPSAPATSASQTSTPHGGQAALGQTTSHRALSSASNDNSSAMTGGTAMVRMNGRPFGDDEYASSSAGAYVPGGGTGGLTPTTKQHVVAQETNSWAAISSMMERPENDKATRVMPALSGDVYGSQDTPSIDDLLNNSSLLDACKSEFDRVARELDELRLLVKQSSKELEKLNHRKVLTAAEVREIEEHMELHSRQEIRAAYLAASEAEMRAFMISEQREQMETKLSVYERYSVFLSRTMAALSALPPLDAAPFDEASLAPWNLPTAGPARGVTGAPAWYAEMASPPTSTALAPLNTLSAAPGHDLATIIRVIDAQESVRQRMAQRLHDGPTQSLANVVLAAEICEKLVQSDPRRALSELSNLKGLVNATLQETRKFIFELRPMTLDDLGLAATLRRYTTDIAAKYHIEAQVHAPYAEQPLPKEVETPVFRVAQEAVMNAVEHSRATVIQVTLAVSLEGVMLVIDDNGSGFDVEEALARAMARQTTGIPNMQDRAELLGGWLRIESMRGRGSRVELAIPLDPKR
ncbi:MAG: histidine kinase [Ktedonobacterales bacterium]